MKITIICGNCQADVSNLITIEGTQGLIIRGMIFCNDCLEEQHARIAQLERERDRYYRGEQEASCDCTPAHPPRALCDWRCPEYVAKLQDTLRQHTFRQHLFTEQSKG